MGKFTSLLKESELFYNLTTTQLELVESIAQEQIYQEGDIIFTESTRGNELFLILSGHVDILVTPSLVSPRHKPDEQEVINTMWRGQCFGEVALVDEGIRSATARAGTINTRLLRITRQDFLHLCESDPELGYRVMFNLSTGLSEIIRHATLQIREALLYKKTHFKAPHEEE